MLLEETLKKLSEMKLHAMARSLRERLTRTDHGDLSIADFVGFVVDDEWTDRQNRKLDSRLRVAHFKMQAACLEDVDYTIPRKLRKQQVLDLAQNHWIEKHQNIVVTGPAGSGKSYLAQALGNHLCRSGHSVVYYRMPKLAMMLMQSRVDGSYLRLLKRIAKTRVLIIDDFGIGKLSQDHVTDLLELVEDRYDIGSTVITAQLAPDEWHDYLGGGVVADGILDRILHNAHKFDLQADESVRKSRKGLSTVEKSEK